MSNFTTVWDPVPYVIIDEFFNEKELSEVWKELDFLTNERSMMPPNKTESAEIDGRLLKQNNGAFIDDIFAARRASSSILTHNRKIWNKDFISNIVDSNAHSNIFSYLPMANQDSCLVSYYEDNDYYDMHWDDAVLTLCVWLYREPKKYTGGDFMLHDPKHIIESKNNRAILFPSFYRHGVTPIKMLEDLPPLNGYGRYTISQFFGIKI